ncbi:uncharacterized protein AB675_157 [Cyphellophora attinorum]|uniref:Uncharacterized protein n=1 Tax=Cyphellophora attinorum TaxID=1664694 RepID=A0A0N1HLA7_9EURO|nr:uncharacterized protein AB675_157 [Phialophora attinorum]KPI37743.1 hypothetical protein AB675_157 [Phialophora attinorum]
MDGASLDRPAKRPRLAGHADKSMKRRVSLNPVVSVSREEMRFRYRNGKQVSSFRMSYGRTVEFGSDSLAAKAFDLWSLSGADSTDFPLTGTPIQALLYGSERKPRRLDGLPLDPYLSPLNTTEEKLFRQIERHHRGLRVSDIRPMPASPENRDAHYTVMLEVHTTVTHEGVQQGPFDFTVFYSADMFLKAANIPEARLISLSYDRSRLPPNGAAGRLKVNITFSLEGSYAKVCGELDITDSLPGLGDNLKKEDIRSVKAATLHGKDISETPLDELLRADNVRKNMLLTVVSRPPQDIPDSTISHGTGITGSRFMDLPGELRNPIYEAIRANDEAYLRDRQVRKVNDALTADELQRPISEFLCGAQMLRVNHRTYNEALDYLYPCTTLTIVAGHEEISNYHSSDFSSGKPAFFKGALGRTLLHLDSLSRKAFECVKVIELTLHDPFSEQVHPARALPPFENACLEGLLERLAARKTPLEEFKLQVRSRKRLFAHTGGAESIPTARLLKEVKTKKLTIVAYGGNTHVSKPTARWLEKGMVVKVPAARSSMPSTTRIDREADFEKEPYSSVL